VSRENYLSNPVAIAETWRENKMFGASHMQQLRLAALRFFAPLREKKQIAAAPCPAITTYKSESQRRRHGGEI